MLDLLGALLDGMMLLGHLFSDDPKERRTARIGCAVGVVIIVVALIFVLVVVNTSN